MTDLGETAAALVRLAHVLGQTAQDLGRVAEDLEAQLDEYEGASGVDDTPPFKADMDDLDTGHRYAAILVARLLGDVREGPREVAATAHETLLLKDAFEDAPAAPVVKSALRFLRALARPEGPCPPELRYVVKASEDYRHEDGFYVPLRYMPDYEFLLGWLEDTFDRLTPLYAGETEHAEDTA